MEVEISSKVQKFIINTSPIHILSVLFVSLLISFATSESESHGDTTDHVVGFVFRRSDIGGDTDTDTGTGEGSISVGWQFPRLDNSNSPVSRDSSFVQRWRGKCSNKFQIPHGKKRILEQGKLVRFRCDNGYIVFGATVAACVEGKWSEPTPVCIAGGCRRPPISAGITGRALFGGAAIIFGCSPGFRMVGENILVCNGIRWNGTAPSCQRLTPPSTTTTPTTTTTTTLPPPPAPATEKEESAEVDDNLGEDPNWQLQTWPWSKYGTSPGPEPAAKQDADGSSTNSYSHVEVETRPHQQNGDATIQTQTIENKISHNNYSLQETETETETGVEPENQTPKSSVNLKISGIPSASASARASDPTALTSTSKSTSTAVSTQKITTAADEIGTVTPSAVEPNPNNRIPENTETVNKIGSIGTSPTPTPAPTPLTLVTVPISTKTKATEIVTEFSRIPELHFPASQTQSPPTTTTSTTTTTTTTTRRYPTRQRRPTVTTTTTTTTTPRPRRSTTRSALYLNSTLLLSNRSHSYRPPKFPYIPIRTIPPRLPTRIPKIRCLLLPPNLRASCMNLTGTGSSSTSKFSNGSTSIFPARTPPGRSYNLTANNSNNTFVFPSWNFSKNRSSFYSNTSNSNSNGRGRNYTYNNNKPYTLPTRRPTTTTTTAALQTTTTAKELLNESFRKLSGGPGTGPGTLGGWSSSPRSTLTTTTLEFDNTLHQILQRENKEKERINEIENQKNPKHELITPFKLDTEGIHDLQVLQHGGDGNRNSSSSSKTRSSFFLVLGSILSTCAVGLAVGVVGYYFWRRNKGISRRSSARDSDGENLPVHLDVEEEFVYFGNNRW